MSPNATAETEGIEPPTLAGSCFQDSFLDQPDSLLRTSIKQQRPESNGLLLVQSESCEPLHYAATRAARLRAGSRRIERRLTGSEPVVRPLYQEPVRVGGIEPPPSVWKTDVLPLHHTRVEQAAEAGIEPAGNALNRHAQLPTVAPPQRVCAAGFEPAISTSQASRDGQLPYAQSHSKKRPAGVEPALPPWQGSRLPLHHGRHLFGKNQLSKNSSEAGGSRTRNVPVKSRVLCLSASTSIQQCKSFATTTRRTRRKTESIYASKRV